MEQPVEAAVLAHGHADRGADRHGDEEGGGDAGERHREVIEQRAVGGLADDEGEHRERPRHFAAPRSEEHTSELQSLMRISYAVFCLKKTNTPHTSAYNHPIPHDSPQY